MAKAPPTPAPAPDPGAVAEKTMEPDQEARAVCGGACPPLSGLVMEEFVMGDHARLVASMRLAMELAASSRLFAKLSDLFAPDAEFRDVLARVRGGPGGERLRVVAYGLGGAQYSWAPRFRLAVLLLLRDAFPDAIGDVEVVCPTAAPVERRAMEELGCVVTASVQQCRSVREPTLIFMPYADHVFFKNLLTLNWTTDQLAKIILLGHSFGTMVKMIELSMSKQEKFGVTEQREKVRRVMAIREYVREIELCSEIDGLLDSPLWGDDGPDDELAKDCDDSFLSEKDCDDSQEEGICMHCIANIERHAMITALPSSFSVHVFHFDPEIDMEHLVPVNCPKRVWSTVNVQMNCDAQLAGWFLNPNDAYIEDKDLKEAVSIVKEVRETMLDVRSSSLYAKFIHQLKEDPSIGDHISSMLGSHECMDLVIYGLGSFEFDVSSQYQLAFALLLKEDKVFPVGNIEIYDPALSTADVKACFDLGVRVLLVNEQCQRSVEKPTLFYVPGLKFIGNLVESNFSPKQLNKVILVSYGLKSSAESAYGAFENWNRGCTSRCSLSLERDRFLWATVDYIHEAIAMGKSNEELSGVRELKVEFVEVDDDMDIFSKLPRLTLKEKFYLNFMLEVEYNSFLSFDHVASLRMQLEERISRPFREDPCDCRDDDTPFWGPVFRHRLPAMKRTTWSPPPKGWIKLNFHGIGCSKGRPACIGGIFHNDKGEVLSYYAGPVGDVDQIVASAMALEMGLKNMIDLHEPVFKLIIEGDNLMVIRWCNGIARPPERASDSFTHSYWYMDLRPTPTEAPAPDKLPECKCKNGEDDGSKDTEEDNGRKDDGEEDVGASSEFEIPPGWAQREYIAWHVEQPANRVTIGLARVGASLPGIILHKSSICDCGHGVNMNNDKPDVTWFFHDFAMGDDIIESTEN